MTKKTWQQMVGLEDEVEVKEEQEFFKVYMDCFAFSLKDLGVLILEGNEEFCNYKVQLVLSCIGHSQLVIIWRAPIAMDKSSSCIVTTRNTTRKNNVRFNKRIDNTMLITILG